jgi:hypothetical protein
MKMKCGVSKNCSITLNPNENQRQGNRALYLVYTSGGVGYAKEGM